MKKLVKKLAESCKEAIENAAYESYSDGTNPYSYDGTDCIVKFSSEQYDTIEVSSCKEGTHEVFVCHKNNEYPNIEHAIEAYLNANANELGVWTDAFDNDIWRGVDPGCDPAFPHHGDFERWAYGY